MKSWSDNNEANRRLFALAHPGECWHDEWDVNGDDLQKCSKCGELTHPFDGGPGVNYFSPDIPHSEVVKLVTAAVNKFGSEAVHMPLEYLGGYENDLPLLGGMMISAPEIAAAIDSLENENG